MGDQPPHRASRERVLCRVDGAAVYQRHTVRVRRRGGMTMPGRGSNIRTRRYWEPSVGTLVVTPRRVVLLRGGRPERQFRVDAGLAAQLIEAGRDQADQAAQRFEEEGYWPWLGGEPQASGEASAELADADRISFLVRVAEHRRRWRPVPTPAGWVTARRRRLRRGPVGSLAVAPLGCLVGVGQWVLMIALLALLALSLKSVGVVLWLVLVVTYGVLQRYGLPLQTDGIDLTVVSGAAVRRAAQAEQTRACRDEHGGAPAALGRGTERVVRAIGGAVSSLNPIGTPLFVWIPDPVQRERFLKVTDSQPACGETGSRVARAHPRVALLTRPTRTAIPRRKVRTSERNGELRRSRSGGRHWWTPGARSGGGEDPAELRRLEDAYGRLADRLAAHQPPTTQNLAEDAEREVTRKVRDELVDDFEDVLRHLVEGDADEDQSDGAAGTDATAEPDDANAEELTEILGDAMNGDLGGLAVEIVEYLGELGAEFLEDLVTSVEEAFGDGGGDWGGDGWG